PGKAIRRLPSGCFQSGGVTLSDESIRQQLGGQGQFLDREGEKLLEHIPSGIVRDDMDIKTAEFSWRAAERTGVTVQRDATWQLSTCDTKPKRFTIRRNGKERKVVRL